MPKLFVAGCSFSDRNKIQKAYGDYLAEHLDYSYVHLSASSGSNDRLWRTVTNAVMNDELTSDDLLIVQYTELTRTEIWSDYEHVEVTDNIRDKYRHAGDIIRFKTGCSKWQPTEHDMQFTKRYEEYHVSPEFCAEQASIYNYNFQHMLHYQKIPVLFLQALTYGKELWLQNHFNFPTYRYSDKMMFELNHQLSATDDAHINDAGHQWLAKKLHEQRNKQWT